MTDLKLLDELGELIEDLTTSGSSSLQEGLMKNVKKICKRSEVYVKHAHHILMTQLKKKHAEIRWSAFQIIKELFQRSHTFRESLLKDFQIFLELTAETDFKRPLPPPTNVAKNLKEETWRTVEVWHEKFGQYYKNLDLGFQYLKRVKHSELDNLRAASIAERQRVEEKERRKQNLLRKKLARVEVQMSEMVPDMQRCLTERESCFKLLLPHPEEYEIHSTGEASGSAEARVEDGRTSQKYVAERSSMAHIQPTESTRTDSEEAGREGDNGEQGNTSNTPHSQLEGDRKENETKDHDDQTRKPDTQDKQQFESEKEVNFDEPQEILNRHGLGTRSYQLSIDLGSTMRIRVHENDDNSVILDQLRESNKEVTHTYLPLINKWLSVLTKCDGMQLKMQEIIDVKRALEASRDKFLELQIIPLEKKAWGMADSPPATQSSSYVITAGSSDEASSDEFEDVPEKEALELFAPQREGVGPVAHSSTQCE